MRWHFKHSTKKQQEREAPRRKQERADEAQIGEFIPNTNIPKEPTVRPAKPRATLVEEMASTSRRMRQDREIARRSEDRDAQSRIVVAAHVLSFCHALLLLKGGGELLSLFVFISSSIFMTLLPEHSNVDEYGCDGAKFKLVTSIIVSAALYLFGGSHYLENLGGSRFVEKLGAVVLVCLVPVTLNSKLQKWLFTTSPQHDSLKGKTA